MATGQELNWVVGLAPGANEHAPSLALWGGRLCHLVAIALPSCFMDNAEDIRVDETSTLLSEFRREPCMQGTQGAGWQQLLPSPRVDLGFLACREWLGCRHSRMPTPSLSSHFLPPANEDDFLVGHFSS